ncbi:MAG: GNAT family N-acetyltransferase [Bacteroidota bacterium]
MSESVTIRRAQAEDVDAAVRLWAQLQDEHSALDARHRPSDTARERWRNDVRVWVGSEEHRVFVAERGGEVVGLVTAHPFWPAPVYEQEREVYVTELIVRPDQRSAGIGAQLLGAVRDWARSQGVTQLRAGVLSRNVRGRAFWAREGAEDLFTTVTLDLTRSA